LYVPSLYPTPIESMLMFLCCWSPFEFGHNLQCESIRKVDSRD
jgi:hypothetical protein